MNINIFSRNKVLVVVFFLIICIITLPSCSDTEKNKITNEKNESDLGIQMAFRSVVSILAEDYDESGKVSHAASATGVIYFVNDDGGAYILTNCHVVKNDITSKGVCSNISVAPYGYNDTEDMTEAICIGQLNDFDLSILYCPKLKKLSMAICGISDNVVDDIYIGSPIFVIGNALGKGLSVATGNISMIDEYITYHSPIDQSSYTLRQMRLSVPLFEGCSGGGVFNESGQFIGLINSRLVFDNNSNIGYCISAKVVCSLAQAIITAYEKEGENWSIYTLRLGADFVENITDVIWDEVNGRLVTKKEITVSSIDEGSIGSIIFNVGDVLTSISINGTTYAVSELYHPEEVFFGIKNKDIIEFTYKRDGKTLDYSILVSPIHLIPLT